VDDEGGPDEDRRVRPGEDRDAEGEAGDRRQSMASGSIRPEIRRRERERPHERGNVGQEDRGLNEKKR
jgi:hypothetical protein